MSSSVSPSYSSLEEAVASIEGTRTLIMRFAPPPTLSSCAKVNKMFLDSVKAEFQEREKQKNKKRILAALTSFAKERNFEINPPKGDVDTQYATALKIIKKNRQLLMEHGAIPYFVQLDFKDGINLFFEPGFNLSKEERDHLFILAYKNRRLDVIRRLLEQPELLSDETIIIPAQWQEDLSGEIPALTSIISAQRHRIIESQLRQALIICATYNLVASIRTILSGETRERVLSKDRNENSILVEIAKIAIQNKSNDVLRAILDDEHCMPENTDFDSLYCSAIKSGFPDGLVLLSPFAQPTRDKIFQELTRTVETGNDLLVGYLEETRNLLNHLQNLTQSEVENLFCIAAICKRNSVIKEFIFRYKDQIDQRLLQKTIKSCLTHAPIERMKALFSLLKRLDTLDELDGIFGQRCLLLMLRRNDAMETCRAFISTSKNFFTSEYLNDLRQLKEKDMPFDELAILSQLIKEVDNRNADLERRYNDAVERGDIDKAHDLMVEYFNSNEISNKK